MTDGDTVGEGEGGDCVVDVELGEGDGGGLETPVIGTTRRFSISAVITVHRPHHVSQQVSRFMTLGL